MSQTRPKFRGSDEKAKGMRMQCSPAHCFFRHMDRSFHFQAMFVMDLKLNDKADLVLLSTSGSNLSATCDELKRLYPEKVRLGSSTLKRLKIKVMETGSAHRKHRSLMREPMTTEEVKVTLQNLVQASPQISTRN